MNGPSLVSTDSRFRSSLSTACLRALAKLADVAGPPLVCPSAR